MGSQYTVGPLARASIDRCCHGYARARSEQSTRRHRYPAHCTRVGTCEYSGPSRNLADGKVDNIDTQKAVVRNLAKRVPTSNETRAVPRSCGLP